MDRIDDASKLYKIKVIFFSLKFPYYNIVEIYILKNPDSDILFYI